MTKSPSVDKTGGLPCGLLDGVFPAREDSRTCEMQRWDYAKDIACFPSTSALNLNAQADFKTLQSCSGQSQ